jgi:hypothetical protein
MVQTWIKDSLPSREETFKRLNRFNQHIVKLGIPNPYSLNDIHKADIRWEKLHGNSVPPLVAFKDTDAYIDECKHVEEICLLQNTLEDDGSFGL